MPWPHPPSELAGRESQLGARNREVIPQGPSGSSGEDRGARNEGRPGGRVSMGVGVICQDARHAHLGAGRHHQ